MENKLTTKLRDAGVERAVNLPTPRQLKF